MDNIYGHPDWRDRLAETLVDLRALPLDDVRRDPAASGLVRLTNQIAIPADVLAELGFPALRFVEAVARGRNAYEAVLTGRSAARVLGMWVVSLTPEPVELALPSGEAPPTYRRERSVVCRRRPPGPFTEVFGARATVPVRTFIEIARTHGFAEGLIAADWLLANGYDRDDLYREVGRMGSFGNVRVVRRCIQFATALSESPYESLARALLIEEGVEGVVVQGRAGRYRMDLLVDDWLAIEVDGDVKYADDPGLTIREEYARQKKLGNMGYVFLRYRPQELREKPELFVAEVLAMLQGTRLPAARRSARS
ncbi:hypothetical protein SAMN04488535_1334 [Corynebacterium mycetoides]|uniref:DUF559 domain-containing protein n=1 Tax=Corynebacterium mycetoides TaxID=38302 RepID=A0A1G9P6S9_9CORY|nr:hypothetical protein SAMN04488535_1334 [Corynebacterium mycetoides]